MAVMGKVLSVKEKNQTHYVSLIAYTGTKELQIKLTLVHSAPSPIEASHTCVILTTDAAA